MKLGIYTLEHRAYSLAFSPSGRFLYTAMNTYNVENLYGVYQFDLSLPSERDVSTKKFFIQNIRIGGLKNSFDGKIYTTVGEWDSFTSSLGIINNPNSLGNLCNHETTACNSQPARYHRFPPTSPIGIIWIITGK